MKIAHVVAVARNNVIGHNGQMPWPKLSGDLKRFKELTLNHPVIMGRVTFDSLPIKPLPKRKNIVITRNKDFSYPEVISYCNLADAILGYSDQDVFIIGGGEIYKESMPFVNTIYITEIDAVFQGEVAYPSIPSDFRLVSKLVTVDSGFTTTFKILERH